MLLATCDTRDMTTEKTNKMIIEDGRLTIVTHFANTYAKIDNTGRLEFQEIFIFKHKMSFLEEYHKFYN